MLAAEVLQFLADYLALNWKPAGGVHHDCEGNCLRCADFLQSLDDLLGPGSKACYVWGRMGP